MKLFLRIPIVNMGKSPYLMERNILSEGLENLLKTSPSECALGVEKNKLKKLMKKHDKYNEKTYDQTWRVFKMKAIGASVSSTQAYSNASNNKWNPIQPHQQPRGDP